MESTKPGHVVFVDDEPNVCDTVRKTLERVGMNVVCFHGVADCLTYLASGRCDLLVTDVKMPGRSGIDLLNEVKVRFPWIPVLVITGYGDVPMAVAALKAGAEDFLEKPLDRETFLDTVGRLLKQNAGCASLLDQCLTKAEMKVLYLVLDGKNNRQIADELHRSTRTIEVHRSHVMRKLGAANLIELLRRVADLGLLRLDAPRRQGPSTP